MTLQVQSIKSDKRHSMRLKSYHKIKNTIQTIKNIKVNNSKKYVRKGRSVRIPFDLKEMQTREEKDKKSKETGDNLEDVLKFLVHFIGDLGQPLHVCGRSYGGNGVLVNFDKLKRINLHSIWDSTILKKRILEFKGVNEYITYLESISSKLNETVDLSQNQVLKWTRDTQHMDCTMVWKAFDENPDQNFGDAYYEEQKHNVDLQLAKSGFRLGKWLDLLFTLKRTRKMAYKDAEDEDEDDTELVDKGKNEDNNGDFSNEEKVKDNNSDSMNKENDFRDETVESNVVKVEVDSLRKSPRLQIEQKKDAPKRKFTTIQDNDSLSRQSDENTLEDDQDQPKRKILKVKHSETKNKETSENVYHIKDKAITNLRKSPRFQ